MKQNIDAIYLDLKSVIGSGKQDTENVHTFVLFLSNFIIDRAVKSFLGKKIMQLKA